MKLALSCLLLGLLAQPAVAAELKIKLGAATITYSTAALLQRGDVRTIDVVADVAFHHPMHYRAVPLNTLLPGIQTDDHLQFVAADGFTAEIPAAVLLDTKGSTAWLAIEDPAKPWPALPDHHGSAGPFYVVGTQPQAAGISPEQWPYQLASIRVLGDIARRFPAMLPESTLPKSSPVRRGFAVFQRICFCLSHDQWGRRRKAGAGPQHSL